MPAFLYITPHAQTRQSFESVGLFLFELFPFWKQLLPLYNIFPKNSKSRLDSSRLFYGMDSLVNARIFYRALN